MPERRSSPKRFPYHDPGLALKIIQYAQRQTNRKASEKYRASENAVGVMVAGYENRDRAHFPQAAIQCLEEIKKLENANRTLPLKAPTEPVEDILGPDPHDRIDELNTKLFTVRQTVQRLLRDLSKVEVYISE
jgi:hypothetical protein